MRTETIAMMALALSVGAARAAEPRPWGAVTGQDVHVRSGPNKAYRDMCKLGKESVVEILGASADGNWLRIAAPKEGNVWIFAKFVEVKGSRGVLTGDKVRVRVRPDLNAELVNRLDKGAVLRVKGRRDQWLKIAPPKGSLAWINTKYVRRMTDDEKKAFVRKKIELARIEAERKRLEAERVARLRREAERKRRETRLVAQADALLVKALGADIKGRPLAGPLRSYEHAAGQVRDAGLRSNIQAKIAIIRAMQNVQLAMRKEVFPAPLPKVDLGRAIGKTAAARFVVAYRLARKIAEDAVNRRVGPPSRERTLDGWITYLGAGLGHTGATHRLTKDGRLLALVRSGAVDLASFVGIHVRIAGKVSGDAALPGRGQKAEIIRVARLQIVFN